MSSCEIQYLEHVQVRLNVNFWPRGDLLVELMSPMKTVSRLTHYRTLDRFKGYSVNLTDWVITSLHHWGEQARGTWNLSLRSVKKEGKNNHAIIQILHVIRVVELIRTKLASAEKRT